MRFEIDLVLCSSPLEMSAKVSLLVSGEWCANCNWAERDLRGERQQILMKRGNCVLSPFCGGWLLGAGSKVWILEMASGEGPVGAEHW